MDNVKLLTDLSEWERRMRLAQFFYGEEDKTGASSKEGASFKSRRRVHGP